MFERYILASSFDRISKRFNMARLPDSEGYEPSYNIGCGGIAYVITDEVTRKIYSFKFGINGLGRNFPEETCFIRAEGKRNLKDDPEYSGAKALFLQPELKTIIRTQRCLVLADAFVVGIEKCQPHLVYLREKKRPFAFAGIWSHESFAIITVPANTLLQKLGMKRMPVILPREVEHRWIRKSSQLFEVTDMLKPYSAWFMNAYPITLRIADYTLNDKSLVQPLGATVYKEAQL